MGLDAADNEGTIGPEASVDLARDFAEGREQWLRNVTDEWDRAKYDGWASRFRDGGSRWAGEVRMTTATDLVRNLALAWWQPVLLVAIVYFGPRLIVKALCAFDFRHTFDDLGSPDAWGIDDLLDGDTWAARQGLVQTDAEADAEWCAILAALDIDQADVRAAYIDNACAEFRRDLDTWETT